MTVTGGDPFRRHTDGYQVCSDIIAVEMTEHLGRIG